MSDWFARWFGEEYLRLYPHRDDDDARRAVGLIDRVSDLRGAKVLDLGCGPGRHAVHLSAKGANVVGFDLSMLLLRRASTAAIDSFLVRGDMRRLPFREKSFDLVVNLFTSFGYFNRDEIHQQVLAEVAAVLKPGATLFMDYLNARSVRASLVPVEDRVLGGSMVHIRRRVTEDDRYVEKEMVLVDEGDRFLERVRLFSPEDLSELLASAGLQVEHRFGDYDGSQIADDSPRAILVATKT